MINKKSILLTMFFTNFLFSEQAFENNINSGLVVVEATDEELKKIDINRKVVKEGQLVDEQKPKEKATAMKETDYTDAILLNFIVESNKPKENTTELGGKAIAYVSKYDKKVEETKPSETTKKEGVETKSLVAEAVEKGYTYVTADCQVEKNLDITNETIVETFCSSKKLGYFKLVSQLTPKVEGKIAGLFGEPKHIEDFEGNQYALSVNSKLINKYSGNTNLATWANKRKMEEWISSSSIYTASAISSGSKEYMREVKEANQKQQLAMSPEGATTVITNNEKPDVMDTVIPTAVDIISNTIKEGVLKFQADLPYLYRVEENTVFKLYANIKKIEE